MSSSLFLSVSSVFALVRFSFSVFSSVFSVGLVYFSWKLVDF
ncbi:hypothetical protein [Helicobacter pylori]